MGGRLRLNDEMELWDDLWQIAYDDIMSAAADLEIDEESGVWGARECAFHIVQAAQAVCRRIGG